MIRLQITFLLICLFALLKESCSLQSQQGTPFPNSNGSMLPNDTRFSILDMEKEVVATSQVEMDRKRVVQSLENASQVTKSEERDPVKTALLANKWQISSAASVTAWIGTFFVFHSSFLSFLAFAGVFAAALQDPLNDEGIVGAASRILGRKTIETVESSKPRLQRIARAAIIDDDDDIGAFFKTETGRRHISSNDKKLARYIKQLEEENASLNLWKERRILVDHYLPYYGMHDLQEKARQHKLDINCGKEELMMRLLV